MKKENFQLFKCFRRGEITEELIGCVFDAAKNSKSVSHPVKMS